MPQGINRSFIMFRRAFLSLNLNQESNMNSSMHRTVSLAVVALCLGLGAQLSHAQATAKGGMLTDAKGMTLYTFDKDAADSGKSVCNGDCAKNWPPLMAKDSDKAAGNYSVVVRDDGMKQWAYKGKPLYLWVKDQKPGDMTGDGVNKIWHVAKP
jgi:predicted lipoprotein with Yx(FWY)xxD motif